MLEDEAGQSRHQQPASICLISHTTASAPEQAASGSPCSSLPDTMVAMKTTVFLIATLGLSSVTAYAQRSLLQADSSSIGTPVSLLLHLMKLPAILSCVLLLHFYPCIVCSADQLHFTGAGGRPDCHQLQGAFHRQPCESLLQSKCCSHIDGRPTGSGARTPL